MIRVDAVGHGPGYGIAISNNLYPDVPPLIFTQSQFADFLMRAKRGDFDTVELHVETVKKMGIMG